MSEQQPEVLQHKSTRGVATSARSYRAEVTAIDFGGGALPPTVVLADGTSGHGLCLGCHDTPCMLKLPSESIVSNVFDSFPGDPADGVCPTEAITWIAHQGVIHVDSEQCIGCGLCVSRCPYGAIYLKEEQTAVVLTNDPDELLTTTTLNPAKVHPVPRRLGRMGRSTGTALTKLPDSVNTLSDVSSALFVRNVLHELGVKCRVRRRGDTNVRIDAVTAFDDGLIGVVEIELTSAALDSPRALLEDIAILHARYALPIGVICPISLVLSLPNARSEYYQVIDDIERVLGIRCRTFTVGALLLLLWNFGKIPGLKTDLFLTQVGGADLLPSLKALVSAFHYDGEPYPAALRTAK
jgi:ferredoxin